MTRRWDEDERGSGIVRGGAFAPGAERLLGTMQTDAWVAEHPEVVAGGRAVRSAW
jgi:hypothetical protein